MKKLLAMLLVAVMSFSLVACGGNATEETSESVNQQANQDSETTNTQDKEDVNTFNLYQEWKSLGGGNETILFNENGTAILNGNTECEYEYNKKDSEIIVNYKGREILITIINENDTYKLGVNEKYCNYVSSNDYETAMDNITKFYGTWERTITNSDGANKTVTITIRSGFCGEEYDVESDTYQGIMISGFKDGNANYDIIAFNGKEYTIDSTADPMTLTLISDENIVYTKAD